MPSSETPEDLTPDEAIDFWNKRHWSVGLGSSGGNRALGEVGNEALYQVRLGQLLVLAGSSAPTAPMELLDAGCGKGIFSRGMARCGFRVSGFDPSEFAIAFCRERAGAREDYQVATTTDYRPDRLFDLVYSIDVMFHIMDDTAWRDSVRRLCSLVRLGGRIALVDADQQQERRWAAYQKTRPASAYETLFRECGVTPTGATPCGPPGYPNMFVIGRRSS